jgi:ABC-2 type transport system permease protein
VILTALRAEWFKSLRRPANWVVIGILIVLGIGLSYVVVYLVATHAPVAPRRGLTATTLATLRASVYPAAYVKKAMSQMGNIGGAFALILGVLMQGSEFGWETVKTAYIQRPGRLAVLGGRLITLGLLVLIMVVALFVADAATSYALAAVDGTSSAFPSLVDIAKAAGAAWLILGFWAAFGFGLAMLFRQSAMAIGLGLAYGLVLENLVFALLSGLGDSVTQVHIWFPFANGGYLIQSFGTVAAEGAAGPITVVSAPDADATHAVLVLFAYLIGIVVICGVLARRRDVI